MIIDLTYHCSMGCSHCMSDCRPDGNHMPYEILEDALSFCDKYAVNAVHFSGGEMFEHPDILRILDRIGAFFEQRELKGIQSLPIVLITNGRILSKSAEHQAAVRDLQKRIGIKKVLVQVTDDPRFYPAPLTEKEKYDLRKLGAIVDRIPGNPADATKCLYPQGRAVKNFPDSNWNTAGPKCGNLRLMVKYYGVKRFSDLVRLMTAFQKMCIPEIAPDGSIKLGESALCPPVASIYDPETEIMRKIETCDCHQCKIAFEILKTTKQEVYKILANE